MPGLGVAAAEGPGYRAPLTGTGGPVPGQRAGRTGRGVRIRAVGAGAAAGLEGQDERQPGPGELAAEPVLVPVGAVRAHTAPITNPTRRVTGRHSPGPAGPCQASARAAPAGVCASAP